LASRLWWVCKQFLLKPALVAGVAVLVALPFGAGPEPMAACALAAFVASLVFLNTRLGRDLEDLVADWMARWWEHVRSDFLPGLFRLVVSVFKRLVEGVERLLYTVDEWLRFRTGDSRLSLVVKAMLGLGWSVVTYFVRLFVNLFLEPTFNPIKHFPVVTVAAKVLLPVIAMIRETLTPVVGAAQAGLIAGSVLAFLPGLAGFLVWEFKENWRLYRANRPAELRPAVVGHHGETIRRLLRPGIHSGTLPKLYAKLRKAARIAERTGSWHGFVRQREALHHVAEAIRHFVDREFCRLLEEVWHSPLPAGPVGLGTNSIRIELPAPGDAGEPFQTRVVDQAGELIASMTRPGWLRELPVQKRIAAMTALAGLYRLSGVNRLSTAGVQFDELPIRWQEWVDAWQKLVQDEETQPAWVKGLQAELSA
jgi:hypothetical protein